MRLFPYGKEIATFEQCYLKNRAQIGSKDNLIKKL